MRYKESISFGAYLAFIFISVVLISEARATMRIPDTVWRDLLPKSNIEIIYYITLAAIFLNTLNWSIICVASKFMDTILFKVDYIYLILSLTIFSTAAFGMFLSIKANAMDIFILAAGLHSARNLFKFWRCFSAKKNGYRMSKPKLY